MYRGRPWTMRQYAGFGTRRRPTTGSKRCSPQVRPAYRLPLICPPRWGLDSDSPLAAGEVGKVGVAINSLDDMRTLLDALPLGEVTTSMTINATAPILLLCTSW